MFEFEMWTRQISCFLKSKLPLLQLLLIILKSFSKLVQCFPIRTFLMSHIRRSHPVKNRPNQATLLHYALKDHDKLFKTVSWGSIVFRENNNGNSWLLNCLEKSMSNLFPSSEPLIIHEGVDSLVTKRLVKASSETTSSIIASETEEHIISPLTCGRRGTWLLCHDRW